MRTRKRGREEKKALCCQFESEKKTEKHGRKNEKEEENEIIHFFCRTYTFGCALLRMFR